MSDYDTNEELGTNEEQLVNESFDVIPLPSKPKRWPWILTTFLLVVAAVLVTFFLTKRSVLSHLPEPEPIPVVDTVVVESQVVPAQKDYGPSVLRVAYVNSDDGFVNVRTSPHADAEVMEQVVSVEGQSNAVFLEKKGSWDLVLCKGKKGYVYSKYIDYRTWYTGNGGRRLVANTSAPIYYETEADGMPHGAQMCVVEAGTIIGDIFDSDGSSGQYKIVDHGSYYYLATGFEGYLVPKRCLRVETVQ